MKLQKIRPVIDSRDDWLDNNGATLIFSVRLRIPCPIGPHVGGGVKIDADLVSRSGDIRIPGTNEYPLLVQTEILTAMMKEVSDAFNIFEVERHSETAERKRISAFCACGIHLGISQDLRYEVRRLVLEDIGRVREVSTEKERELGLIPKLEPDLSGSVINADCGPVTSNRCY